MSKNHQSVIKRKQNVALIALIAVTLLVVINSLIFYTRVDLTKNKVYSISKVSRDLVKTASDTVYIDYYISSKLKTATFEPQQMIDILQEYQARSGGRVVFAQRDADAPQYLSEAEAKGLQPQQIQVVEQNQATYAVVYSGLIIRYQDKTNVIPFFLQPSVLEYQITSKIQQLITGDTRVAGILTLDDTYANPQALQDFRQVLEADYEVKTVAAGSPVPDDVDSLFVLGAQSIDNDTAYYVDQFLMKGKGAYFAADKVRVDVTSGLFGSAQKTLLHDLLADYGITVENKVVLDQYNKLIPVNRGGGLQVLQPYPMWVTIAPENANAENPVSARFAGLDLYWSSPLTVAADKAQYVTTLVSSSPEAWTKGPENSGQSSGQNAGQNPAAENPDGGVYILQPSPTNFMELKSAENTKAYDLTDAFVGPLTSAVERGTITIPTGQEDSYVKSTEAARFIVTGSSLFASWITRASNAQYNFLFLSNASDWLGSDERLLQIKSRGVQDVRLNKISDPVKERAAMIVVQLWNIILLPLIIIIVSVVVLLARRRSARRTYGEFGASQ